MLSRQALSSHLAANGKMAAVGGEAITVSEVCHDFATRHNHNLVLDDVTVFMKPGEMTLLHGVSGSGKTTLLNVMSGLLKPTSGTVLVEGIDIYSLSTPERDDIRLNRIGMIFQEHSLIADFTARENVELILRVRGFGSRSHAMAVEALEKVAIGHLQGRYPRQLSGGEAQRVGIARAIAGDLRSCWPTSPPASSIDAIPRWSSSCCATLLRMGEVVPLCSPLMTPPPKIMRTDPVNWSMVTWRAPADADVESSCLGIALSEKLAAHDSFGGCFAYHDHQPRSKSLDHFELGTIGNIDARSRRWIGGSGIFGSCWIIISSHAYGSMESTPG